MIDGAAIISLVAASIGGNAGGRVTPDLLQSCFDAALRRYAEDHPRTVDETLAMIPGASEYATQSPVLLIEWHDWTLPIATCTEAYPALYANSGESVIRTSYPPKQSHIDMLGSGARVMYATYGRSTPDEITDRHTDRIEVLTLANVMLKLSSMDIIEPIQLHRGMGDMQPPRSAIDQHRAIMKEYAGMLGRGE